MEEAAGWFTMNFRSFPTDVAIKATGMRLGCGALSAVRRGMARPAFLPRRPWPVSFAACQSAPVHILGLPCAS